MIRKGLSVRDFARRDGCSASLVQHGKEKGRLWTFQDGSLDPALVGTDWRESARNTEAPVGTVQTGRRDDSHPVEGDEPDLQPAGIFATRKDAEKHRDTYVALLRQLEYERERGKLIEISKVALAMEEDYSRVRTRLLSLPSEHSPSLHRCRSVAEVNDLMMVLMIEVLEELSGSSERLAAG